MNVDAGDDGVIYTGSVVMWDPDRGFGFLRPDGAGRNDDVFVPASRLADSGRIEGTRLRFAVKRTTRGPQAKWTAVLDAPAREHAMIVTPSAEAPSDPAPDCDLCKVNPATWTAGPLAFCAKCESAFGLAGCLEYVRRAHAPVTAPG